MAIVDVVMPMFGQLFTVGCSVQTIESFVQLLVSHSIQAVADVRSVPFSRRTPQFNAPALKLALGNAGISYIPMGTEFGARRKEPSAYKGGRVDFDQVKALPVFRAGIERIRKGLDHGLTIAIMCTEKDPIDCHRFVLVSRNIERSLGVRITHLHTDGRQESTESIEDRMIQKTGLQIDPLFNPDRAPVVEQAYGLIGAQISYSENTEGIGHD